MSKRKLLEACDISTTVFNKDSKYGKETIVFTICSHLKDIDEEIESGAIFIHPSIRSNVHKIVTYAAFFNAYLQQGGVYKLGDLFSISNRTINYKMLSDYQFFIFMKKVKAYHECIVRTKLVSRITSCENDKVLALLVNAYKPFLDAPVVNNVHTNNTLMIGDLPKVTDPSKIHAGFFKASFTEPDTA